ncbi:unnamed protein product [Arctia plantaginis]|uniref:Rrn7/TAF1B C-terminal cyclin domain-containing protein n=1 Tax=Arctia plantaginis TaxID=874455 RepID=A0A8S1BIV9_ARCPL|nr:unnamed protein product [Arctia plantaginis]
MEVEPDPCNVCGGTDSKLIDGFYYCIECGTQNTNVRETILEEKALGDGTFAQSSRRKIVHLKKDGIEMSGEWYKWHAFNFIVLGLADELVCLGAKPTFKLKLLWIWTRYMKKYQNKSELMMNKTTCDDRNKTGLPSFMAEEDSIPEAEELEKDTTVKGNKCDITSGSRRDIKFLSKGLIIAMLYLALNLDESEIQLCDLYRFVKEKELDISNPNRFVPQEINVKKIPEWLNFVRSKLCTQHQLRALAMSLLRKLNLGTPKVPDLKKLVDNFLTELCLPNDLKPLIYSLMHFRKCSFLDIDNSAKQCLIRTPDYEGTVMSYVLVAIKICFGLDNNYEMKLSNVVEKINEVKDLQKSYRIGKYSEPSDRLFSFKEWCSYINFRKIILSKYNSRIAESNGLDIDDYVYLEQMESRPKNNEELPDKISMEIISRLPQDHCVGVIPKELFIPTLTPMSDYTEVIIDHCQDPEIKLKLAEDFKQYSIKYVCEHLELVDTNNENIVTGVSDDSVKIDNKIVLGTIVRKKAKTNMIYIKNCENRNWLKTNRPTIEHVTYVEPENKVNDKESDHGYDSENTSRENELDSVLDKSQTERSIVDEIAKNDESEKVNQQEIITEENLEVNIFDDDFEDVIYKEECERNDLLQREGDEQQEDIQNNQYPDEDFDRRSDISDEPLIPAFNPDTFDREKTIKELILFACGKYKIPVPSEYKVKEPRKRKEKILDSETTAVKRSRKSLCESKAAIKELLSNYYNHLQSDFVTRVQQEMSLCIRKTELENGHLEANDSVSEANLDISVVERHSTTENQLENPVTQSELNSTIGAIDEPDFNATDKTDTNDKTQVIDENVEKQLFEDDEDMNLNDLIPKGDPEFDEKKYEVDQLYIEIKEENEEEVKDIMLDVKADPELDEILVKKIEECESGTTFAEFNPEPKKKCINKEESDSEDDIPLSVFKQEAMLIEKMFLEEDNYEYLIKKENIPEFKYWVRRYDPDYMLRCIDHHTKFDEELKENTSTSFYFVIQKCASVINCTNFYLYKNMQLLEEYLISKAKNLTANFHDEDND